jgi:hypothetical protein
MNRRSCAAALALAIAFSTPPGAAQKIAPLSPQAERGIIIINDKTPLKPGMTQGVVKAVGTDWVEVQAENGKILRYRNVRTDGIRVGSAVAVEVDPVGG